MTTRVQANIHNQALNGPIIVEKGDIIGIATLTFRPSLTESQFNILISRSKDYIDIFNSASNLAFGAILVVVSKTGVYLYKVHNTDDVIERSKMALPIEAVDILTISIGVGVILIYVFLRLCLPSRRQKLINELKKSFYDVKQ